MLLEKKNLEIELLLERNKTFNENDFLAEIKSFLDHDHQERVAINDKIKAISSTKFNEFCFDLLETDKIFHIDQIKAICIDYRMRFLDSHLFKNDIPDEAISKIKNLEVAHHTPLDGFKIMAPSKLFHLKNFDDPLLFVPIGNNYFYLIHKWGNDLSPFRKITMRPFRNLGSLISLLLVVSLGLAFLVPQDVLGKVSHDIFIALSFLFIFKSLCGITLYYCFWQGKNFNEEIWDSKFYN